MTLQTKHCPVCFIEYAIPPSMDERRKKDGQQWWCPNGHTLSYGDSEADKLRRERDLLAQRIAQRDDQIRSEREMRHTAERQAAAQKGQVTRLKRRAHGGAGCPHCNRHFSDLRRHIETKHPDALKESA